MFDYNAEFNWFEEDDLAKDWFNRMCGRIAWQAFERQEDWLVMAGERENRKPMVKENFFEVFEKLLDDEFVFMRESIMLGFLRLYYDDDIDVIQSVADEYNWQYGYDADDNGYMRSVEE